MHPNGIECFCGDFPLPEATAGLGGGQPRPAAEFFTQKVAGVAWRTKPSWYIEGNNAHSVHPGPRRFVAKQMGADTTALDSAIATPASRYVFIGIFLRALKKALRKTRDALSEATLMRPK